MNAHAPLHASPTHSEDDPVHVAAAKFVRDGGAFLLITDDHIFVKTFRTHVHNASAMSGEVVRASGLDVAQAEARKLHMAGRRMFVFIEQIIDGSSTLNFVEYFRNDYPDALFIVLSLKVDQNRLVRFQEAGVNDFISKPASPGVLADKIVNCLTPSSALDLAVRKAEEMVNAQQYEQALKIGRAVLAKRPSLAKGVLVTADALAGLGKTDEAVALWQQAEEENPVFLAPLKKLARHYADAGDKEQVVAYLRKLDAISPLNMGRKVKIGDMLVQMGKAEEAEDFFDGALTTAKEEAKAIVNEMSADIAEKVLESNPELAEKYFRKALEVENGSDAARVSKLNRLAMALRKQGKWEKAVEMYSEAETLTPQDENIQYNLAMAYAEGGDFEHSAGKVLMALKLNPKMAHHNAPLAYQMGVICKKAGKLQPALEFLELAAAADADYRDVAKQIATLKKKQRDA